MSLTELKNDLAGRSIEDCLIKIASCFPGKIIFTSSFGIEDQVLTHLIFKHNIPIVIGTIDTGRLFPETYKVFNDTLKKYQKEIKVYFPDHESVEKLLTEKGPFSFYYSKENRFECCHIRKVGPLNRALEGKKCWISGIRADQSENRSEMEQLEYDERRDLYKFYPLFNWSFEEVRSFITENYVPYNILHDRGYVSIGCEPCTRAIREGEDFRAGRWWWENRNDKECGLHVK
jgi:phosphoadenosine phosphosulfate reductase